MRPMREHRGFRRPERVRASVRTRLCNSRQDNAHVDIRGTDVGVAAMVSFSERGCRDLYLRELTGTDGANALICLISYCHQSTAIIIESIEVNLAPSADPNSIKQDLLGALDNVLNLVKPN